MNRKLFRCMNFHRQVLHMNLSTSECSLKKLNEIKGRKFLLDPNAFDSFSKECIDVESLKQLHGHVISHGQGHNVFIATKLVGLYGIFGKLQDARQLFDKIPYRNIFTWNEIIKGYASNGLYKESIALYDKMREAGVQPDRFTFPYVLKACAGLSPLQESKEISTGFPALELGKEIHYHVIRSRLESNVHVGNALVNMYGKCRKLEFAREVFDKMSQRTVVSWTAMISGYIHNGRPAEALQLYRQMQLAGVIPNRSTVLSVLLACGELGNLEEGSRVHDFVVENNLESDVSVVTALVNMYAKCGSMEAARLMFNKMPKRDVILWSAMIAALVQVGQANEALMLFIKMQEEGLKPCSYTVVSVLQACAHLGALQQGTGIHEYAIRSGIELNVFMGAALIDMYAKCGNITVARKLFDNLCDRNVVSWSVMIAGYGMHGLGEDAIALFTQMLQAGLKPNLITFTSVLSACSHAGLLQKGWHYFDSMSRDYCIRPRMEHYTCMVDLLGRAGYFEEAQDFIQKMPLEPDDGVWGALLNACRIHCHIELGQHVAECLFDLKPKNAGYYVLLSNIYAAAGKWDKVKQVRARMEDRKVKKRPGCSLVEVNNMFHAFLVGDRSHPESKEIYAMLDNLSGKMKEAGYVPNVSCVLCEIEEEAGELALCSYSEKLAITFGTLNTTPGTSTQTHKNITAW